MLKPSIYKAFYNNYKDYIISKELYKYKNICIKEYIYNFKLFGKIVAVVFVALVATNFIGELPPEREKYMSKKLKKQSVYSVADLESLKGFTVDEVKSDSRGLNVTMKLVNKAGNVVKIYVDSVLFGAELVKYTEE